MSVTQFTTTAKIKKQISLDAYTLRTDDSATDTDVNLISQVIDDASLEALEYLGLNYSMAELQASNVVEKHTRYIAVKILCERRINPVPQSAILRYEKTIAYLEQLQSMEKMLPDAMPGKGFAPVLSNVSEKRRPLPHAAVDRRRSTGKGEGYIQHRDITEDVLDYSGQSG